MNRFIGPVLIFAAASPAIVAESLHDRYLAERNGVAPCYARTYDAAHLKQHPRQRLTRFFLQRDDAQDLAPPFKFQIGFGFQIKSSDDIYSNAAGCDVDSEGAVQCYAEADGGSFKLNAEGDGLRVTIERLELEGGHSASPNLGEGGDDRVVILHPAPAKACDVE